MYATEMTEITLNINSVFFEYEKDYRYPDVDHENNSLDLQTFKKIYFCITTILIFSTNLLLIIVLVSSNYLR